MGGFAFSMGLQILTVLYLPLLWFMIAQGTKRCHDLGTSGWFQIIPFYIFVMLFSGPASDADKYGVDPREEMKQIQDSEGGFFE